MNRLLDANRIYEAGSKSIESSSWKYKTQEFEKNHLLETAKIQDEIANKKYKADKGYHFIIKERGKTRNVTSIPPRDKAVNHLLCDEVLSPILDRYLIHDNGASREGKGVSFHRRRFEQHLHEYYRTHGSNKGYILLGDFKNYYGSINASKARALAEDYLIKSQKLTNEEFELASYLLSEALGGGVGINIGGQPSQNIGILFATRIDQYAKTVKGFKTYARYSDDFSCIHESKEALAELKEKISEIAKELGLQVHPNKTYITTIDKNFTHLQIRYRMTDSGHLIRRIKPESIKRERDHLKAYKRLKDAGKMTDKDIENNFKSWLYQNYKVMSKLQLENIYKLYIELFGKEITKWKSSRLHYLITPQSWNETRLALAVEKSWITADEYLEITGQEYTTE